MLQFKKKKKKRLLKDRRTKGTLYIECPSTALFSPMLNHSHLSPQDDSDDEPSTAKRAHSRGDALEYIDESCEEGEETASSEMHSEVMHSPLDESALYKSPPPLLNCV